MAGTNRNQKLGLNEAWKHYWSVFFPGGVDWCTDLEGEIRKRLYFPGETKGFRSCDQLELEPPSWASDLELELEGNSVTVKFRETNFGIIPLFTDQLITVLSNWTKKNPLDAVGNLPKFTDRDREKCGDFCVAAVRDCGSNIQNHMLGILKETERPQFEIYSRPSGDAFRDAKKIPEFALSEISRIDIANNELKDGLSRPIYRFVQIKKRRPSETRAGPHGSFRAQDAALVENMKSLIDCGDASSVRQAAQMVLAEAPKRTNSTGESVMRRLLGRFSDMYPNYSNSRGN